MKSVLPSASLLSLGFAATIPTAPRAACGEGTTLVCYGSNGGTPQNLTLDDISYAASYLRYLADQDRNPLWTMPPEVQCSEWTLPLFGGGTVMALTKHINPRTNSSVTYYDLARTIDGGENATPDQVKASLLGACGTNGGQIKVDVNLTDLAYHTPDYVKSGAKPEQIIVKLVRDPSSL